MIAEKVIAGALGLFSAGLVYGGVSLISKYNELVEAGKKGIDLYIGNSQITYQQGGVCQLEIALLSGACALAIFYLGKRRG